MRHNVDVLDRAMRQTTRAQRHSDSRRYTTPHGPHTYIRPPEAANSSPLASMAGVLDSRRPTVQDFRFFVREMSTNRRRRIACLHWVNSGHSQQNRRRPGPAPSSHFANTRTPTHYSHSREATDVASPAIQR